MNYPTLSTYAELDVSPEGDWRDASYYWDREESYVKVYEK